MHCPYCNRGLWRCICNDEEAPLPQSFSVCPHCHHEVTPGHSCPQDPNRLRTALRDDLAQNSAARAGHEVGTAAAETVAGILYEADADADPVALARTVIAEPGVLRIETIVIDAAASAQRDEAGGDER